MFFPRFFQMTYNIQFQGTPLSADQTFEPCLRRRGQRVQQRLDAEVRQNDELPPPEQPIGQTGSALRDRRVLIIYNYSYSKSYNYCSML